MCNFKKYTIEAGVLEAEKHGRPSNRLEYLSVFSRKFSSIPEIELGFTWALFEVERNLE
jgi:hypothetical protein